MAGFSKCGLWKRYKALQGAQYYAERYAILALRMEFTTSMPLMMKGAGCLPRVPFFIRIAHDKRESTDTNGFLANYRKLKAA